MGTTTNLPDFDKLWNYGDPAGTEAKFRDQLPRAEAAGDDPYRLALLTQIARTQGLQGKFDAAHATLDVVERELDGRAASMPIVRLRYLLERGRVFNSSGEPERAMPLFVEAWQVGDTAGDNRLALDAVHMVAIVQPTPQLQVEWNRRGIELAEARGERGWLFALYNNLGEAHLKLNQYDQAKRAFETYADLERVRGQSVSWYVTKDIAKCLRLLGRADEATAMIRPVYDEVIGKDDENTIGYVSWELAECLLASGETAKARPLFARAYDALSKDAWLARHEPATIERLRTVSAEASTQAQ